MAMDRRKAVRAAFIVNAEFPQKNFPLSPSFAPSFQPSSSLAANNHAVAFNFDLTGALFALIGALACKQALFYCKDDFRQITAALANYLAILYTKCS